MGSTGYCFTVLLLLLFFNELRNQLPDYAKKNQNLFNNQNTKIHN